MLLIFDCDGVLTSSSWSGIFEAYKKLIASEGKNWRDFFGSFKEFRQWWSPDWRRNEDKIGIKYLERAHEIFYEVAGKHIFLLPWADYLLEKLSRKHKLALLTNRHLKNAEKQILPIKHYFEIAVGAENLLKLKPDPEGIFFILEQTGMSAENTIMIGDMPEDLEAARRAGVKKCAAVIWKYGLGNENNFAEINPPPDFFLRTPSCFLKYLLNV